MNPEDALTELGDKVVSALAAAVTGSRNDLRAYRSAFPNFVAEHSERGLANWIHDRMWAHLGRQVDGVERVFMVDTGPTRELFVGLHLRLRIKRHGTTGGVRTYPTPTALAFMDQAVQLAFDGLSEVRLIAGYRWLVDERRIGPAVLSYRDSIDHVLWEVELPETGSAAQPVTLPPRDAPRPPTIDVHSASADAAEHGSA